MDAVALATSVGLSGITTSSPNPSYDLYSSCNSKWDVYGKINLGVMIAFSLIAGPIAVLYLLYKYIVFPVFLSPLSKIPSAHFTSSFSALWILFIRHSEQENCAIHAAHVKYGNIVRLGPNEVSIACVDEGIRSVYSGGFEKWRWYPVQFANYG